MTRVSLGWVLVREDGKIHRPKKTRYNNSTDPRIYTTEGRAKSAATYVNDGLTAVEVSYEEKRA